MKALTQNTIIETPSATGVRAKIFARLNFNIIPAIVAAALPKCPLCLAAYLSVFGVSGISPLQFGFWLLPAMVFFSAVTIILLFYQARRTQKYIPFFLSLIGLIFISAGKFYLESSALIYAGIGILLISSVWLSTAKQRQVCCNEINQLQ